MCREHLSCTYQCYHASVKRELHRVVHCHRCNVLQALDGWVDENLQVSVSGIAKLAAALAVEVQCDILGVANTLTHAPSALTARYIDGKAGHVLYAAVCVFKAFAQSTQQSLRVGQGLVHVLVHLLHVVLVRIYLLQRCKAGLGSLRHKLIEVTINAAHLSHRQLLGNGFSVPPHKREHPCRTAKTGYVESEPECIGWVLLDSRGYGSHSKVAEHIARRE